MKFRITELVETYGVVGDEYKTIHAKKRYEVRSWDDLQNFLLTLIDFSDGTVKLEIEKEDDDE
jgi:hypothetical protein